MILTCFRRQLFFRSLAGLACFEFCQVLCTIVPAEQARRGIVVTSSITMDASSNNDMDTDDGPTRRKSNGYSLHVPPVSNGSSIQRQLSNFHRYFTWKHLRTTIHNPPPAARSGAASVVVRGKLYVFGGYGGGTGRLSDFWYGRTATTGDVLFSLHDFYLVGNTILIRVSGRKCKFCLQRSQGVARIMV